MKDNTLVYVIADYGALHDLAFAEVKQRIYYELRDINTNISTFSVPAFDTVATGFALAQTAVTSKLGSRHKFYVNTAPRKDDLAPRVKNAGEGFVYVKLFNGIEICAVNSGYTLSFIKPAAEVIREIRCEKAGSQFRSRDIFPPSFGKIALGNFEELGDDLMDAVPDYPKNVVCYTDGYGNMKCSITLDEITKLNGNDVTLDINSHHQIARVADGIFGVADGQFCLSQGSSGWALPDGNVLRFCEVVKRGGSAAQTFNNPGGGTSISWRTVS